MQKQKRQDQDPRATADDQTPQRSLLASSYAEHYGIAAASAQTLERYNFGANDFDQLRQRLLDGVPAAERLQANQLRLAEPNSGPTGHITATDETTTQPETGTPANNPNRTVTIEPPRPEHLLELPQPDTPEHDRLAREGWAAIRSGEVAVLLLAGGMATRFGGGVKALAEVVDGLRFVDAKLTDLENIHAKATAAAPTKDLPMWLMTSFRSDAALREWASQQDTPGVPISFAPQSVSMRLQLSGELFCTSSGHTSPNQTGAGETSPEQVSLYAPGHGDACQALQNSGLLDDFISQGGRQVVVSNVDNVAATLDPAIIGAHRLAGNPITCEVTYGSQVGGAPWLVNGKLQIVEAFRLPPSHESKAALGEEAAQQQPLINTNSFVFDAAVLAANYPLTWFEVHKQVDGQTLVQFERLIGELTAFVDTTVLLVESDGPHGRFQPVKDPAELRQRQAQIRSILQARQILPTA